MGFFSSDPAISKGEYKEARTALFYKGFTAKDLTELDQLVRGDIEESDSGITKLELNSLVAWLRKNPSKHRFPPDKVDIIEEVLTKKL